MSNLDPLVFKNDCSRNSKLYEFLATNYDISSLASKIQAENNLKKGILSLRKMGNSNDIANA